MEYTKEDRTFTALSSLFSLVIYSFNADHGCKAWC